MKINQSTHSGNLAESHHILPVACACVLWSAAGAAITLDQGVIGPAPQSLAVNVPGTGIFLDTINFDVQAPNTLFNLTSTTTNVSNFNILLFRNSDDTQIANDTAGTYREFLLTPGQGGYHLHPQGIATGGSSYELTLFTSNVLAAIIVSNYTAQATTESGGSLNFDVSLSAAPVEEVRIPIASSNTAEAVISTNELVFASGDAGPKTVTVTGVDDIVQDGNTAFQVQLGAAVSNDIRYSGLDAQDPLFQNLDDEAGFRISAAGGRTTEAGGAVTFTVALSTNPIDDVTINLFSTNTLEGTVSPATLTFQAGTATQEQTVTVTGVDDLVADGPVSYAITFGLAVSADPVFNGLQPSDVPLVNDDDDSAAIIVTPTSGLVTDETGVPTTFTVVLATTPNADVTLNMASSDTTEARISPTSLTFTPLNATTPQPVSVAGVDDFVQDGDIAFAVLFSPSSSLDPAYNNISVPAISGTNVDDDLFLHLAGQETPGCTVLPSGTGHQISLDRYAIFAMLAVLYCRRRWWNRLVMNP